MPSCYRRRPQAFREAITFASRDLPLSPEAVVTLYALVDFAGEAAAMPDAILMHGGMPVNVATLVHTTHLTARVQKNALLELSDKGFLDVTDRGEIMVLDTLTRLPEYDTSTERVKRFRERVGDVSETLDATERVTSIDHKEIILSRDFTDSVSPNGLTPSDGQLKRARRRVEQTALLDPEWLAALRAEVEALNEREIGALTANERFTVARLHAAVFGHCRVKERTNRHKAGGVALSLSHLGDWATRNGVSGFTVAQYFAYGRKHHERIGRGVWLRPWDLKASLETA